MSTEALTTTTDHEHYWDSAYGAWQCRECDCAVEYCTGPNSPDNL